MWKPGSTIVHQEVWQGRLWAARPLIVVEDTPERLLLWIPKGTVRKVPVTPPTRPDPPTLQARTIESLDRCDWVLGEHLWDVSCLWILHPDDWHAIWVSWSRPSVHLGWYVNLQCPFRRTNIGIEAMDLMLDIVIDPDGSWLWKDDDEFDEIEQRGIFEATTVARIREEAATVIERIEANQAPFSEDWVSWAPDPTWQTPVLPEGWDMFPS
jgi:protein associated with RNAse G/E